ncbi:hypothetical protein HMN09_00391000 [Mycena chlorophos]|uniref:Uncharacterized protein n=1 Tax=Mycena chlorophos TaxID=658473 RepID=A0A8H6TLC1_MYCCL|nr:hypothetical protein HMN09_00391000 [Mycena chlorophos]
MNMEELQLSGQQACFTFAWLQYMLTHGVDYSAKPEPEISIPVASAPRDLDWEAANPRRETIDGSPTTPLLQKINNTLRGYYRVNPTTTLERMRDALRDARAIKASVYRKPEFVDAMQATGLAATLLYITDPTIRHEVLFPHTSNGKYNWRQFWAVELQKWTPYGETLPVGGEPNAPQKVDVNVLQFLRLMNDSRFIKQMTALPENVCLLLSRKNFLWAWNHWLAATVKAIAPQNLPSVEHGWRLDKLFRDLTRFDIITSAELQAPVNPMLNTILILSKKLRDDVKKMAEVTHHPQPAHSQTQPRYKKSRLNYDTASDLRKACLSCDPSSPCIREYHVTKKEKMFVEKLKAAAKFYDPVTELGFDIVRPRPHVFASCGRDITIFKTSDGEFRFGVQYNAFGEQILEDLCASHEEVNKYANAQQREDETQTAGKLKSLGARIPKGGRKADGLAMYACQDASTPATATAFLKAAHTNDTLIEHVRAWAPDIVRQIKAAAKPLLPFGRTSQMAFYCSEYASPQHFDKDGSWSLCCQLKKTAGPDEYNFVFAEYGVVIETQPNTLWVFNPQELHGTLLPRRSSYKQSVSSGIHTTLRSRDLHAAEKAEHARLAHSAFKNFWGQ